MVIEKKEMKLRQRQIKTLRLIVVIIGGLMLLLALFADAFEVQLLLAGLVLLLVGWFGRRISAVYRALAIILLNTLLLFIGLELAASTALTTVNSPFIKDLLAQVTGKPNDLVAHHYLVLPYYAEQEWTSHYWREHKLALKKAYQPYVIWRSPPFTGELVNIDQDGIRLTPTAACISGAYKVFMFGGSAMWGWGAPDWGTIPAYLQAELQTTHNEPVCVVNFGENAFVSTQSLIQLQLELDRGNVPDVVIFYDGVNEVLAASQTGQPILHQNFIDIANRFENPEPPLVKWFRDLNSFKLLQLVMAQIGVSGSAGDSQVKVDTSQLADTVAQAYLGNYKTVAALAETYGFDYYFFWQPHILVGNKPLTSEEQNMIKGLDWVVNMDSALMNLFTATYGHIELAASEREKLYYMAYVFDDVRSQLWIDTWGHVTPEGNRLVAQEMLAAIEN